MRDWFDEKSAQVSTDSVTAFGIPLISRHSKASELSEMLAFAVIVARANLQSHIARVFYDSNSCCCAFEFTKEPKPGSSTEQILLNAARSTISQFEWSGHIEHGGAHLRAQ